MFYCCHATFQCDPVSHQGYTYVCREFSFSHLDVHCVHLLFQCSQTFAVCTVWVRSPPSASHSPSHVPCSSPYVSRRSVAAVWCWTFLHSLGEPQHHVVCSV